MEHERRSGDRELARLLRFLDGDGVHPGIELRLDRMHREFTDIRREVDDLAAQVSRDGGSVSVLQAQLTGHPLLDKAKAALVVEHVDSAAQHQIVARNIGGALARRMLDVMLRVVELLLLAYIAAHLNLPIGH